MPITARPSHSILINTDQIELWPAALLRARSNADARTLARASQVLRRKADGRYLAAAVPEGLIGLLPAWNKAIGIDEALDQLDVAEYQISATSVSAPPLLPLNGLQEKLKLLGLNAKEYARTTKLQLMAEPAALVLAGFDRYQRALWLTQAAGRAWNTMRHAAMRDDVLLDAISGYRSHAYQLGIFERKLARGQTMKAILAVNAAPGYSEHHTGTALDIGTSHEPPAETSFEHTAAFKWLSKHAARFDFYMSYPRNNPHEIVYEPWHWRHIPPKST